MNPKDTEIAETSEIQSTAKRKEWVRPTIKEFDTSDTANPFTGTGTDAPTYAS